MKTDVPGMRTLWIIGGLSLMSLVVLVYLGREADPHGRNRVDLAVNQTIALDLALNLEVLKLSQGQRLNYDGLVAIGSQSGLDSLVERRHDGAEREDGLPCRRHAAIAAGRHAPRRARLGARLDDHEGDGEGSAHCGISATPPLR